MVGIIVSPSSTLSGGGGAGGGGGAPGIGYALPVDTMRGLVDQIMLYGKPMRPALGITFAPPQVFVWGKVWTCKNSEKIIQLCGGINLPFPRLSVDPLHHLLCMMCD